MSQPTVSKHLRVLREAGFVEATVDAQRRLYRLRPEPLQEVDAWLAPFRRFWSSHVDALERHLDRMHHPSTNEKKDKEKTVTARERYAPGPASGAQVEKDGETVDAGARQRAASLAGKGLAGAHRSCATSRVGAIRCRSKPRCRRHHGEAHHGRSAHPACDRNDRHTSRRAQRCWNTRGEGTTCVGSSRLAERGTRLTLWTNIDRRYISMGAAGWHVCFDVLDHLLGGDPIGRIVGPEAMKFDGWQRLNAEYAQQFGVELPKWPPKTRDSHRCDRSHRLCVYGRSD